MLYLVHKTTPLAPDKAHQGSCSTQSQNEPQKQQYVWGSQKISDNLFSFQALDTRYHLKCNILLDIQEIYISHERGGNQRDSLSPIAVCTFPEIDEKMLIEKSFGNEYILEVLRTQFHLNILESLLLLCEDVNASGLMINISPHNPNPIEIYQNLIVSQNQVFTENGEQTQVLVSIDVDTYDQLIDCIEKLNQDFRKTLWQQQWGNPSIREYLKSHSISDC